MPFLTSLRRMGPGMLVTAAFIGPGTVTTASQAGAQCGFDLLWAVVFAVVATIVLQEMAARLGLVSRQGLGEALRRGISRPAWRYAAIGLVLVAIGLGNAAYQTGNLTGASTGLQVVTGIGARRWSLAVAAVAALLLGCGVYRYLERLLVVLVAVMSAAFLVTAVLVRPDVSALLSGALVPRIPAGSLTTVIGLIGTTIVPYNLFLHASAVSQKWPESEPIETALAATRWDTVLAVAAGGMVTSAIMTTAATAFHVGHDAADGPLVSAGDMARQLAPSVGTAAASWLFAVGLFAAGLTSAVTAPLAAGYAVCGCLGWPADLASWRFRAVWLTVLVAGAAAAVWLGHSPVQTILVAQVANGLLLPIIALLLLLMMNRPSALGPYTNGLLQNLAGAAVVMVVVALAAVKLWSLW